MLWEKIFRPRSARDEPGVPEIAATHPTSYVAEIELALISAVFAAGGGPGEPAGDLVGVRVVTDRWHRHRGCSAADNLHHISGLDDHAFGRVIQDRSTLGGRPRSCVVQDAADALVQAGVEHAADLVAGPDRARAALAGVRGLDPETVERFCRVLGAASDPQHVAPQTPQPVTPVPAVSQPQE